MTEILKVENVKVRRGDTMVLDGVDWSIQQGEQWVILGANGSGKTSLLNTLSGFLQPTEGDVTVFGEVFGETDWKELRNVIGIVNHTVADWIENRETALEIVISGIHAQINYWGHITADDEKTAQKILRQYRLSYAADRTWEQLSQGERQRALICRALLARYRLLILDEPCAGLDPVARAAFLKVVEKLAARKRGAPSLILVTHHVEEITPSFSHVLLMKNGKAFAAGPKDEVLTSAKLSEAFGADLRLRTRDSVYQLELTRD
ncbi:MAG: iron complex transport system ATP-binding protein [Verrucomicrobiales bacterium]|jgi:iron complex transport system ATP-binding protein